MEEGGPHDADNQSLHDTRDPILRSYTLAKSDETRKNIKPGDAFALFAHDQPMLLPFFRLEGIGLFALLPALFALPGTL
jgi:hypothetical protein